MKDITPVFEGVCTLKSIDWKRQTSGECDRIFLEKLLQEIQKSSIPTSTITASTIASSNIRASPIQTCANPSSANTSTVTTQNLVEKMDQLKQYLDSLPPPALTPPENDFIATTGLYPWMKKVEITPLPFYGNTEGYVSGTDWSKLPQEYVNELKQLKISTSNIRDQTIWREKPKESDHKWSPKWDWEEDEKLRMGQDLEDIVAAFKKAQGQVVPNSPDTSISPPLVTPPEPEDPQLKLF